MSDESMKALIVEHLYGELGPAAEADFLKHTASCTDCRDEMKSSRRVLTAYRSARPLRPPADAARRALTALSAPATAAAVGIALPPVNPSAPVNVIRFPDAAVAPAPRRLFFHPVWGVAAAVLVVCGLLVMIPPAADPSSPALQAQLPARTDETATPESVLPAAAAIPEMPEEATRVATNGHQEDKAAPATRQAVADVPHEGGDGGVPAKSAPPAPAARAPAAEGHADLAVLEVKPGIASAPKAEQKADAFVPSMIGGIETKEEAAAAADSDSLAKDKQQVAAAPGAANDDEPRKPIPAPELDAAPATVPPADTARGFGNDLLADSKGARAGAAPAASRSGSPAAVTAGKVESGGTAATSKETAKKSSEYVEAKSKKDAAGEPGRASSENVDEEAVAAIRKLLTDGQARFKEGDFAKALSLLNELMYRFPFGKHVGSALATKARCEAKLGNLDAVKETIEQLRTSDAKAAASLAKELKAEAPAATPLLKMAQPARSDGTRGVPAASMEAPRRWRPTADDYEREP